MGYQHQHTGMIDALSQIYNKHGIYGLWRGSMAAIPRAAVGSGAQIATFGKTKYMLKEYDLVTQPTLNSFCAGLIAGSIMSVAITPPDVISTRLYNQGWDERCRYNGWLDCCIKILKAEGIYSHTVPTVCITFFIVLLACIAILHFRYLWIIQRILGELLTDSATLYIGFIVLRRVIVSTR